MPSHLLSPAPATAAEQAAAAQARFWNRMARRYAASAIADPAGYEKTVARVQALLAPGQQVLEIGCGTGSTALRLAPGLSRLLATDVSPAMIAIAREKPAAAALPQLQFEVGAAAAPAQGAGEFDAVLAFNLLHLVSDLDGTLRAVLPALKPGGLFISKTPCLAEMNPLLTRVAVPLLQAVGLAPAVLRFDEAQLRAALERHGLAVEAVERHGTKRRDPRVFLVARKR